MGLKGVDLSDLFSLKKRIFESFFPQKVCASMLKRTLLFLCWLPLAPLSAQVYWPGPHDQQHQLPRGAYVACVDDIVADMAAGDNSKYQDLKQTITRHNLNFLAFYGLHFVVDNHPQDNANEAQLRFILNDLHQRFPKLKIGAVGGGRSNPTAGKVNAQEFERLRTDGFLFRSLSDEACPQEAPGVLNSYKLHGMMNPLNPTIEEQYQAEVVKYFARIASNFGFEAPESRGLGAQNGKTQSKDYFDHLVLEDEWWWRHGAVRTNLDDHLSLLQAMRTILHLSHACEAKVITYESIQRDITGVSPMDVQAFEISALSDRVLVTHYFKCVPNTLERYCEAIEAWGGAAGAGTELWPLFSSEDASAKVTCSRFDPNIAWNEFWGVWMDTTYSDQNPPAQVCPGPGNPGYGFPYEVDEAEDLYLLRLDSASKAQSLPLSSCPNFQAGAYQPKGFMWFIAHLMDPHGRSHVSVEEVEASLLKEPMVFPNPSSTSLRLSHGKALSLQSLNGQNLGLYQSGDAILVAHLPQGIYLLEVEYAGERYFLKVYRS